ncbi:primosomal replication protein [Pseudoalteromonas xiamenensis]|uniref:Primosomal replication protein n=2 Tax=Pseudoalteromonas xiamenensis TaxID=882626 RepID=A0A975HMB6_9GAMM|nr:primosomal replication protein [Pseudoalteromonas xiamenensis]QTH72939.1 primosomal replication protein [Pseudoalteromonas xiamenensis]
MKAVDKLTWHVENLVSQAEEFDKAKWFDKNRYIQSQPSLFSNRLFVSKSLKLRDYVDEIVQSLASLPPETHRHAYQFAITKIGEQIEAVIKVLKSTPVWAKENKPSTQKQQQYRKAVTRIMQSSHELYQELSQNHEFERRLMDMIEERKRLLDDASKTDVEKLNKEIFALHMRLGRCRKAIAATEEKILFAEKQSRS